MKAKIEAFDLWCLRRMLIPRIEKVKNVEVFERMDTQKSVRMEYIKIEER